MKKLNTFDKEETLNTVGYSKVYLDGKTYLVNFNDRDSVEKFVKFLNNTRGDVYDIFEDKDNNLTVYRKDQYEIKLSNRLYLHYTGKISTPEQPINYKDMFSMFAYCLDLISLDLSAWDVSKVNNMSFMFDHCMHLELLDITNWDTSNVTDMSRLFMNCKNLGSLNLSNWDTSKVTNMVGMFWACRHLKLLDLTNWDTSNVTGIILMFCDTPIGGKYPNLSEREIIKELGGR